jgi:acyl carrier protein
MDQKILDRVCIIVSNLMQVPLNEVTVSSSPVTIKAWDSLQHLNLILSLEETFGLQFAPEETIELLNVETIVLMVEEKIKAK